MGTLSNLKFSTAKRSTHISPVLARRNKIVRRIWEQMQLAKAQAEGGTFAPVRAKTVTDSEGLRRSVDMPKRVRPWWWTADSGKLALTIRYGAKVIELAKGKATIEIASKAELIPTLELIKKAVEAGELDTEIAAASVKLKEGFQR
jgi:hypothetical protein